MNVLATAAAVVEGVAVLPSPPPTMITATVLRHCVSALISRDASVRTSSSMCASGASIGRRTVVASRQEWHRTL